LLYKALIINIMAKNKYSIIAGPCSVNSEEELYKTAKEIHNYIDVLRCGVWKARTNPNSFNGSGDITINWLYNISKELELPVAIEVGIPSHIEKALKKNIRIFWIGARTTVNPFYINELCEVLKGENVEVWIKNPIYPDIKLWIGAFERFEKFGINNLKAIHRGFFPYYKSKYRNNPQWKLVDEFKEKFPEIELICDPSHIAGNTKLLESISKKALKKGMNGLMIETHCKPENALSDARQQINPGQLKKLITYIH